MAKKKKASRKTKDDEVELEERFAAAETRPQFRSMKKNQNKVVLDERFASVLTDSRFQLQGKDKYGRKKKRHAAKEELSAFYTIEDDKVSSEPKQEDENEAESSDDSSQSSEEPTKTGKNDESSSESGDEHEDPASRIAYLTALSRGELDASSSSDEDDSSQSSEDDGDEEDGEDPVYGNAGVLDPSNKNDEIELSYDDSPFLVATQLDWENIRAVDIFSILSSFVPPGGVKSVQVYQSDFGIARMTKDRLQGPTEIWKKKKVRKPVESETEEDTEDDDNSESDSPNKEAGSDDDHNMGDSDDSNDSDSEEDDDDDDDDEIEARVGLSSKMETVIDESDFDPEKLRAYEASKLKYYFAVVEFTKPEHADIAYREVDGMEFEHSSSAIDLRTLPVNAVEGIITDRPMRDTATSVPSNYDPPEFIVSALQKTSVQCTWDQGDQERERQLTRYHNGGWSTMTDEAKDLQVYLASDASSDDDSEDEMVNKGSKMRKLLGLDSDDEDDDDQSEEGNSSEEENDSDAGGKTMKFIPGSKSLEEKIRNKLEVKDEEEKELTPWEKYQEKRKQKRRERRQASRNKKRGGGNDLKSENAESATDSDGDDFFVADSKKSKKKQTSKSASEKKQAKKKSTDQELELLLAGEHEEEEARDYDIRGIQRMEKNKDKKLKGGRKRKEEKIAADVSGKDFKINVDDDRFAAVLEGSDDRFGIDKTDPNFKDTSAMREILSEQSKRRKTKRRRTPAKDAVTPNVSVDSNANSAGASALSMLVKKLKTQVSSNNQ